jgi:hypothetical protein
MEHLRKICFWWNWSELQQFLFYCTLILLTIMAASLSIYYWVDVSSIRPTIEQIEWVASLYFSLITGR